MDSKPLTNLTCRVCLNVEELMVNIYGEIGEVGDIQSNLVELLEICGGLIVDRSDNLSKYLCKVCTGELLVAAKFREKCAKSNELLKQMTLKEVDEPETAQLVYITEAGEVEDTSYATMTEEILNEIIIEEVEDRSVAEWSEEVQVKDDQEPEENLYIKCEPARVDVTRAVEEETSNLQFEDNYIVFDQVNPTYIVETISEKKEKISVHQPTEMLPDNRQPPFQSDTKKKMQKAAPFKFDCDECGAAFSNSYNLRRHLRMAHAELLAKTFTCLHCLHLFTKKASWQEHCQSNHPNEPPQPKVSPKKKRTRTEICSICGKVCTSETSLKVHMRTHTGDRPYPCTECEKAFKTQAALRMHLKRHAGQFDWECEVCGKQFVESSNLRVHMRTHTGEKPHLCKLCGRKFSRVFLLQLHLRTHTGEKPYKCDTCHKAYSQKGDLDIHKRSHTGVRPFVCPICFRGFVKSYALQKHLQRQHPKETT